MISSVLFVFVFLLLFVVKIIEFMLLKCVEKFFFKFCFFMVRLLFWMFLSFLGFFMGVIILCLVFNNLFVVCFFIWFDVFIIRIVVIIFCFFIIYVFIYKLFDKIRLWFLFNLCIIRMRCKYIDVIIWLWCFVFLFFFYRVFYLYCEYSV